MRLCYNKYFDRDGETRVLISVRDIIPKLTREKHNRKWNKMDGYPLRGGSFIPARTY